MEDVSQIFVVSAMTGYRKRSPLWDIAGKKVQVPADYRSRDP